MISLFGDNPGLDRRIDEPVVANVRPAEPKPVYQRAHDLPPDETRRSERAADGFVVAIRRRVCDNDGNAAVYAAPSGQRFEMTNTSTSGSPRARPLSGRCPT